MLIKSIWLGFTIIICLGVFLLIFGSYQEHVLSIDKWIIAFTLGSTGLLNLLVTPEKTKHVNRLLGVWLLFGLIFFLHGASQQSLFRELKDAKIAVSAYRETLKQQMDIPFKGGQPWQVHQFLLAPPNIRHEKLFFEDKDKKSNEGHCVRILGINALSVIHGHQKDLQRIIGNRGTVEILLLHPDSNAFIEKEFEEGKPTGKEVNRIRKEWEASIAILRDIAIKLEEGKHAGDLDKRFKIKLFQSEPDRSLLFVERDEDEMLIQNGKIRKVHKKYLLLNPYSKIKKEHGQASLSLLVDDKWTEYKDNENYFFDLWNDYNTVVFDLTKLEEEKGYYPEKPVNIVTQFKKIKKSTPWDLVNKIKMNFKTHHPQGMVKIGDYIYFSTVEVIKRPEKWTVDGYDRTAGKGIGHLFKADLQGNLVKSVMLGEKDIYHPGGIDYDGKYIWVPVIIGTAPILLLTYSVLINNRDSAYYIVDI